MGVRSEVVNVFSGRALTIGGNTIVEDGWPLGEGWRTLILRFNIVLTIGTGSGALAEALQRIIQNLMLNTDADGIIVNTPARPLFRRAQVLQGGTAPPADAFSAASGTYRIIIPIHLADPLMVRPDDTILDTRRYKRVTLQINTGNVDRLLSTVGTSSITATLDIDIERPAGSLPDAGRPMFHPYIVARAPVNPNSQLFVDQEYAADLAYKRLFVFTSDGSDSSANSGDSFQGVGQNNILNLVSIEDQDGYAGLRQVIDDMIQRRNVVDYSIDGGAVPAGYYIHDYVQNGNINDAEFTGQKSLFRMTYTTDTLAASSRVHVLADCVRALKR